MIKPTFAERCLLAEQCLPDAPYRAMLEKLHTEMLKALREQPAQRPWVYLTDAERQGLWRVIIGWGDPSHNDED